MRSRSSRSSIRGLSQLEFLRIGRYNNNMTANLRRVHAGAFIAGAFLLGCSHVSPLTKEPLVDKNAERIAVLEQQVQDQEAALQKLTGAIDVFEARLNEGPKVDRASGVRPEDRATKKKVPKRLLLLPAVAPDPEGEDSTVANSLHESMHWYLEGLDLIAKNQPEDALKAFSEFLRVDPEHVYADRAQYWLARAHYLNRDFVATITNTNLFESRYADSMQLSRTLLLRAQAFIESGQVNEGRALLRNIVSRFPSDPVAQEALGQLASAGSKNSNAGQIHRVE
ncbi:MAG: tetratricopeptide repeat protein [Deltaproteobacteria bacterium]|nr:tetratricopeptide repeat protein [Deltaproteobacteria bacterium]